MRGEEVMAWSWDFMLQVFRSLGGEAENIAPKAGPGARGLVPVDPQKQVYVHVPQNLIFPISDVEFVDGHLKIKETAPIEKAERTFFENYYSAFSWGNEGRAEGAAFLSELEKLRTDVFSRLPMDFGLQDVLDGDGDRLEQWFLGSRMFTWRGAAALVPVMEMINHAADARHIGDENGLSVAGQFSEEVVMMRNRLDPFRTFLRLGVASPEARALSLPMNVTPEGGGEIEIAQYVNTNSSLGSGLLPEFRREGDVLWISHLWIGNSRRPKLSRSSFYRIMSDAERTNAEQTFDFILHNNMVAFLKLLETLEDREGALISVLRKVVRFQLEGMSWCIGHRALRSDGT
jgi:hypothetical protein